MTALQEAHLNMFDAVKKHCDDNPTIIITVPAFATTNTAFKTNVALLTAAVQQEDEASKGITTDKKVQKKTLAQAAANTASSVSAYASSISDEILKAKVNFSYSTLFRTKDDQLAPRCQNIYDAANTNLTALAAFGITTSGQEVLAGLITAYQAKVPAPRLSAAQKKTIRKNIADLIKTCTKLLKEQMDKSAVAFKAANPDFYSTYLNVRIIVNPKTKNTQITGKITSAADNSPVKNASVQVIEKSITLLADANSIYSLKPATTGTYTLKASAPGFLDQEQTVKVLLGKVTTVNFSLTPA